ncbi:senescence-associated family protein [Hibiscus syriacus]|uniref:Senescence-associated family protein n=1 Tax=Hibiscus syriacus TaxID=106335 RepID=A0A6A2ZHF3_HIBSY|nr:protein FLX-like 4 isoform X1 [Hibiscus syriacus]KAE8690986.1 senescence-associated family protein [Hibiscus syriacus]
MGSRKIRSAYEGRSIQAPGAIRHGSLAGSGPPSRGALEPLPRPELLENKIASQAAELEQLAGDNQILTARHVALKEDLVAARHEAQKLKEHIRSVQNESDIQIRVLKEKIAKMETDIRVGENVKMELQQALTEAQSLVKARQELIIQIQQSSQELEKTRDDVKCLPKLQAELEGLRKEYQRLRVTFQYEKRSNIEQVEQMQAMEKNLIGMAKEVKRLQAEVSSAEKTVPASIGVAPYAGGYMNPDPSYVQPFQGSTTYFDGYGLPAMQMGPGVVEGMIPYGSNTNVPAAIAATGGQAAPSSAWGATYDPSFSQR